MPQVDKRIAGLTWGNTDFTQEFHHATKRNSDGSPMRVRRNGKCKTWKTRPAEFQLPVKYGMYECGYITHNNAHEWFTTAEEAAQCTAKAA